MPGQRGGQFGDERLNRKASSVADFDGKPVDCRIDYAVLIEGLLAVIDISIKGELWVEVQDEPIVVGVGALGIRSDIDVAISLSDG